MLKGNESIPAKPFHVPAWKARGGNSTGVKLSAKSGVSLNDNVMQRGKTHRFTTAGMREGVDVEVGRVAYQRGRRKATKEKQLKKHAMFEICQCEEGIFIYFIFFIFHF